ncbi:MAG: hypothetical protein AABX70_08755 [Nanoarchaeota archaeon]
MSRPIVLLLHSEAEDLKQPAVLGREFNVFSANQVVGASAPPGGLSLLEVYQALGRVAPKVVVLDGGMEGRNGSLCWKEHALYATLSGASVIVAGEGRDGLEALVDAKREGVIADHVGTGADSTSQLQEAVRRASSHRINMMHSETRVPYSTRSEEFVFDPNQVSQLGDYWQSTIHNPEGVFDLRELLLKTSASAYLAQNLFASGEVQTAFNLWSRALNMTEYAKQEGVDLNLATYLLTDPSSVHLLGRDEKKGRAMQEALRENPNHLGNAADALSFSQLETLLCMSMALESAAQVYSSSLGVIPKKDRDDVLNGIYGQLEGLWGHMRTVLSTSSPEVYWRAEFAARIGLTEATQRRIFEEDDPALTRFTELEAEMLTPSDHARLLTERLLVYVGRAERAGLGSDPSSAYHLDQALGVAQRLQGMSSDLEPLARRTASFGIGAYRLARMVYDPTHQDNDLPSSQDAFIASGDKILAAESPFEARRYLAATHNRVLHLALTTPSLEDRTNKILDLLREAQDTTPESPIGQRTKELYAKARFAFGKEE